jgi:diguanylate cyclase (GGDEF)-like protein
MIMQNAEKTNSISGRIKSELTRSIYPNLLVTLPSLAFIASMLVFKLRGHVNTSHLFAWLGVFLTFAIGQGALALWFNSTKNRQKWDHLYSKLLIADAALIGLLWGTASVLFLPQDTIGQSYLIVVLAFVAAGGPLYLSGSYLAGSVYASCTLIPLIATLLLSPITANAHEVYFNITIAIGCYWLFLMMVSHYGSKLLIENSTLRLTNKTLCEDLAHNEEELEKLNFAARTEQEMRLLSTSQSMNTTLSPELEFTDPLTGLDTKQIFEIKFIQSRAYARRHHQSFAMFLININNFHEVKATLGDEIGSLLLKTVAVRLQYCKRETDILSRLDENRFALLVSEILIGNEVMTVVNKVLKIFDEKTIINDNKVHINASIGISMYPKDGIELPELINNAETALTYLSSLSEFENHRFQIYAPELMRTAFDKKTEKSNSPSALY